MSSPGGVFSTTERMAALPSLNTGGASLSTTVTLAIRRSTETWGDAAPVAEGATAGSPRTTWKLSRSSYSSSSRMLISMVASVCPAAMVIVPELGSCSCIECPALPDAPESPLLVHCTWTALPTDEVSLTGNCALEPSVTGLFGS